MSKLTWREKTCMMSLLISAMAAVSPAQTFTALANFDGTNGGNPETALAQGTDGNYYGTASQGGANKGGVVFKITPDGALTVVYSFTPSGPDGWAPRGALTLGPDGNLYGTTIGGPSTVFRITPAGVVTTLYRFCSQIDCNDGDFAYAGLLLGANGNFYGTTTAGGTNERGTIFELTPAGTLTVLYNFTSDSTLNSALVQGGTGIFMGLRFMGAPTATAQCTSSP